MKSFKLLLIIVTLSLLSSCASFQVRTINYPETQYTFNQYDYNSLHFLYVNNPSYFYNTFYVDQYGVRQYYYTHPYFVRYCAYRNITPNHNYYIQRRNNRTGPYINNATRRNTRVRTTPVTRRTVTPIRRTNTTRRSTTTRSSSSTVRRQNMAARKKAIKAKIRIPTRHN